MVELLESQDTHCMRLRVRNATYNLRHVYSQSNQEKNDKWCSLTLETAAPARLAASVESR